MSHASKNNPNESAPAWLRPAVQIAFLLFIILIGVRFGAFVQSLNGPQGAPTAPRPPAVEAFLPISSFMNLTHFFKTGGVNRVHPAGFVIFSLTLVLALAVGRGFCSWVCPIGTISEYAHKAGRLLFGFNITPPKWIDIPLRSLKYILLAFFAWFIFRMSGEMLGMFLDGPYNRLADVKMYLFFANISRTAIMTLLILLWLSILIKNFWCRYLCPYGALLGLLSTAAPVSVRRDAGACVNCGACARACPNRVAVNVKTRVNSPECMACYSCVRACPEPGALRVAARPRGRPFSQTVYSALTIAAFVIAAKTAAAFGLWHSSTSPHHYKQLHARIHTIGHPAPGSPDAMPRGQSFDNSPNGGFNANSDNRFR